MTLPFIKSAQHFTLQDCLFITFNLTQRLFDSRGFCSYFSHIMCLPFVLWLWFLWHESKQSFDHTGSSVLFNKSSEGKMFYFFTMLNIISPLKHRHSWKVSRKHFIESFNSLYSTNHTWSNAFSFGVPSTRKDVDLLKWVQRKDQGDEAPLLWIRLQAKRVWVVYPGEQKAPVRPSMARPSST